MNQQVIIMACTAMLLSTSIWAQNSEVLAEEKISKNDITNRSILIEKEPLAYPSIREADILWESDIWRVIDVREKMNLPFCYPKAPLFSIITDGILDGDIPAYSVVNDEFTVPLSPQELGEMMVTKDTIIVIDPTNYNEEIQIVENIMNWEDVKRFRIKEKYFFDSKTSTMKVRIMGIAPMREYFDDKGNFRYEAPMFWINYAESRSALSKERVFNIGGNQSTRTSWEDLFEMRYFSSYVIKNQNVHDRRLFDYLSGTDALVEGQRIEDEIFNFEQDFWVK